MTDFFLFSDEFIKFLITTPKRRKKNPEIGATECSNTWDPIQNTDLAASYFVSKQTKLLIRWKMDNIYIYIYMKSVTFLWGRACKQIWLHFSRGGAWKQIWVLLNYAKNYLLNFFREESRYAIANKSSCCVIRDFVTPCSKILCYFRERESADEPMGHQTNKKKIGFCFNWV